MTELGYDLTSPVGHVEITTAGGRQVSPVVSISRIGAFGLERADFAVISQDLPSGTPFNGLLGLDFFRGQRLTLDFREGLITLD